MPGRVNFACFKKILPLFFTLINTKSNMQLPPFVQLIYIFHSSGMVALGKLKNPATDRIERDLGQAKQSIEMLEMLKDKTNGRLTDEEQRMLDGVLTELRLNYVDEVNKDKISAN